MKLVPKLTLAFIVVVACVLTATGLRRVRRESAYYRDARDRDASLVARTTADAAGEVWSHDGRDAATAMMARVGARTDHVRIRWVCLDHASTPDLTSVDCASMATIGADEVRLEMGEGRRYVYVPVIAADGAHGAIEVSVSLVPEEGFVRRTVIDAATMTLLITAIFSGVAVLLGFLYVARPTQALVAKARRVGKGDLSGPLVLRSGDEFGELAAEMNAMCAQLADANARMKAEAAARGSAMDQLRHADRLTTVGKLASGIAHELGTPLNVVEARASMIASGEAEGAVARQYADVVVEACERMTRIIRQLLDFARRSAGDNKTDSDLVEMARQSIELVRPLARMRNVELRVVSAEEHAPASADVMQLQQAITNLVVNAIQASDDGRAVEVEIGRARLSPPSDVGGVERDYDWLRVKDEGGGIAREHVEHVFEPFFTTKDVGEGTGLGLSVAYGIVRDHGGWIAVESEVGRGTRFSIYLPRAESSS